MSSSLSSRREREGKGGKGVMSSSLSSRREREGKTGKGVMSSSLSSRREREGKGVKGVMSSSLKSTGDERPRFFDSKTKSKCWENADVVPGRHPDRWRQDAAGNVVCKRFRNCQGCHCYEYDHIVPFSKGGESTEENCQILQTRANRFKSDKEKIDTNKLKGYSCDVKYTEEELDRIEMDVYGNVLRPVFPFVPGVTFGFYGF